MFSRSVIIFAINFLGTIIKKKKMGVPLRALGIKRRKREEGKRIRLSKVLLEEAKVEELTSAWM